MLPGEEYAKEKGYSIYSHSGNKEHATYVKYSYPHRLFDKFEMQLAGLREG